MQHGNGHIIKSTKYDSAPLWSISWSLCAYQGSSEPERPHEDRVRDHALHAAFTYSQIVLRDEWDKGNERDDPEAH